MLYIKFLYMKNLVTALLFAFLVFISFPSSISALSCIVREDVVFSDTYVECIDNVCNGFTAGEGFTSEWNCNTEPYILHHSYTVMTGDVPDGIYKITNENFIVKLNYDSIGEPIDFEYPEVYIKRDGTLWQYTLNDPISPAGGINFKLLEFEYIVRLYLIRYLIELIPAILVVAVFAIGVVYSRLKKKWIMQTVGISFLFNLGVTAVIFGPNFTGLSSDLFIISILAAIVITSILNLFRLVHPIANLFTTLRS